MNVGRPREETMAAERGDCLPDQPRTACCSWRPKWTPLEWCVVLAVLVLFIGLLQPAQQSDCRGRRSSQGTHDLGERDARVSEPHRLLEHRTEP